MTQRDARRIADEIREAVAYANRMQDFSGGVVAYKKGISAAAHHVASAVARSGLNRDKFLADCGLEDNE